MSDLTTTTSAEPIPVENSGPAESFQEVLSRQIKNKPQLEKIDYSKIEENSTPAVSNPEDVTEMGAEDFLKYLESDKNEAPQAETEAPVEDSVKEEPVKKERKKAAKDAPAVESFSLDDIDLTAEPATEAQESFEKKPKSKEENFADLRKKAETYETEVKTKEAKLAEYEAKLKELEETLERTAFEKSPKFLERYKLPYEQAIAEAASFAKDFDEEPEVAERALSLKGKERIEYIDGVLGGGAASAQFLALINNAESKRENLEQAVTNYKETYQSFNAEDDANREHAVQNAKRVFDRVKVNLATKLDYFRFTDNEEHNERVNQRLEAAEKIVFNQASQNEMAAAPFFAVIAKEAIEDNAKLKAELARYKSRAKEDSSVEPRISRASVDDADELPVGKPLSATEAIRKRLRGI